MKHLTILAVFQEYLRLGYFPYFLEHPDEDTYLRTLEQGLHTTIESDLLSIYPRLAGVSIKKLKMLLSAIARSAPSTPDMKPLKQIIEVGDERTGGCQASCHPSTSIYKVYPRPHQNKSTYKV
jgi:predicted AAA+ superfamily ATPase